MSVLRTTLLLALSCISAPCISANAQEHSTEVGRGVICGTSQQAVRFARLRADGKDADVALQTVNNEVSGACNFGLVVFTKDIPVAELSVNGRPASVIEITVHAFNFGSAWKEAPDVVRYTVVMEKGLIA